jgi:hypothetical protein
VRQAGAAALVLALAGFARADSSLGGLADALAREVARQAAGRPVELAPSRDQTGRGASLALDFDELLRERLGRATRLASAGPRLQVLAVVAEAPGRLVASARLVQQPEGRLQDLVSVSVEADVAALALAARPPAAAAGQVDVLGSSQSAPLPGRVLDLAFMGADRILVLGEDELSLYRLGEGTLELAARRRFAGPLDPVRHPGGILRAVEGEGSAWAATSRARSAVLFGVEDAALVERQRAEAVPWPGSRDGLRFRPGTDLIEGSVDGLGGGPFLHLDETGLAVDRDGRLLGLSGPPGELRVGPTLAPLWPRHLAVSTAARPGERDSVLVLSLAPPLPPRPIGELPVPGSVRALAARTAANRAWLVAAVDVAGAVAGSYTSLVLFELAIPSGRP